MTVTLPPAVSAPQHGLLGASSVSRLPQSWPIVKKAIGKRHALPYGRIGGAVEVSCVTVNDELFEVKATAADPHLGGEALGNRVAVCGLQVSGRGKRRMYLAGSGQPLRRLRAQCERAWQALPAFAQATIDIDLLFAGLGRSCSLSRARCEELGVDYFRNSMCLW